MSNNHYSQDIVEFAARGDELDSTCEYSDCLYSRWFFDVSWIGGHKPITQEKSSYYEDLYNEGLTPEQAYNKVNN